MGEQRSGASAFQRKTSSDSVPRKRRVIAHHSKLDLVRLPIPGQQVIEPAHGIAVGQAFQHVVEVGERLDVVEFSGGDERADGGPADAAAVGSCKEMVLAAECDGSDRALDRIVVELDAAVAKKEAERFPASEGIADSFCKRAAAWYARKFSLKPRLHRVEE